MGTEFLAGSAEVLITPPLGVSMAGYYQDRKADDIHDDLFARAVVLTCGDVSAALVVCDLIGLNRSLTLAAREMIQERTGIPLSQIMVTCTHTHTGPATNKGSHRLMSGDECYLDMLPRKIADAAQIAFQRRQPGRLKVGRGHVEGVAFNRRYWMKDGSLRTIPGFQDPDIVRPAGPIDPELGILLLESESGQPLALVSNYALHADEVGGTAICADYQGVEASILKQVLGKGCAVLVPNGCCGDINHLDHSKPAEGQKGFHVAQRSGTTLAGEAIKQLCFLSELPVSHLFAASRTFEAPLRVPSAEEVAWAEETAKGEMRGFDRQGLDVVRAHRMLGIKDSGKTSIPIEISVLAAGDFAFVGLPGEIFVELGLVIKEQSPFAHTFVAELCNDSIGYVPTRAAYDQGGYEPNNSRVEPGTGERMVEVALELLREAAQNP